ncbi:MAG TPA: HupE/UreJ family protein [Planctomycetes bacterium]|nr:HupE/UreJ family protein [Planctomycetota bacterium]
MGPWHLLLFVLLVPGLRARGATHPDSISRTRVEVHGRLAEVWIRFQTKSAVEVLPDLDADGDGELSTDELDAGAEDLGAYLLAHWRLIETGVEPPVEVAVGRLEGVRLLRPEEEHAGGFRWAEARLGFEGRGELRRFTVDSRLFLETNPFHRDFLGLVWNGEDEVRVLFAARASRFDFEPESDRRPGVLGLFLRLGIEHILSGFDHLAFLLALLVAAPRWKSLLGVVTAFTLAHSITLAATVLDPDGPLARIPGRFVELAIALSIAYVAFEGLLRSRPKNTWPEAFGFGLLHGLGFASYLGDALRGETLVPTALFGFNLGVEVGQLAVVVGLSLVLLAGSRAAPGLCGVPADGEGAGIVPAPMRRGVSALVFLVAMYWFAGRAGWF